MRPPEPHTASPSGDIHSGWAVRLNELLAQSGLPALHPDQAAHFEAYLSLLLRWNARTNLTAVRDPEAILSRHFLESIGCAFSLPTGIRTLLDFGSGAGFPGLPIALCRPDVVVTLAESQQKKAAFLQEAVRTLGLTVKVHAARAEDLGTYYDCVTMRAVDRMADAVAGAARLVHCPGWLALMTTGGELATLQQAAGPAFVWRDPIPLPASHDRILALGQRQRE